MVVVGRGCVAVMVVQWLRWRRVCGYESGVVVAVEGVCSDSMVASGEMERVCAAAMAVRWLWWRQCVQL